MICKYAGCIGLTSITIPNSVSRIGEQAFRDCSGLAYINIPNSVTSIGEWAFYGCSGLSSISIPNTITEIGEQTFKGCSGLTSVAIPNSITKIGKEAFSGCLGLASVTLPNYIKIIDTETFKDCTTLNSITIPNSVTIIENGAFNNCSKLVSVSIPNTVTTIKEGAFQKCVSLTSIIIPNLITNIESYTFSECKSLTSITIPNAVINIEDFAFYNCSVLKSVILPNSITNIGKSAFENCYDLTSINLPNSITKISEKIFKNCYSLKSITIPHFVSETGISAFENCTNLESVTFGENVKIIRQNLFAGCTKISQVTSHIQEPLNMVKSVFADNVYTQATLTVPDGTTNKYLACDGWKDFLNIIEQGQQSSFILTISGNNGGKIAYGSQMIANGTGRISVSKNQSVTLTITPNEGFEILSVTLNGEDVTDDLYNNTYTIAQIKEDFEFVVTFAVSPLYVTIKYADGGVVKQKVEKGQVYEYKIEPADGWHIHSVTFNGIDVTSELSSKNEYKTPTITENSELYVTFEMGATNVSNFTESKMRVNAYGGAIRISGAETGEKIAVYSADGKIVKSVKTEHGTATIVLPENQTYIVKGWQKTVKVRL